MPPIGPSNNAAAIARQQAIEAAQRAAEARARAAAARAAAERARSLAKEEPTARPLAQHAAAVERAADRFTTGAGARKVERDVAAENKALGAGARAGRNAVGVSQAQVQGAKDQVNARREAVAGAAARSAARLQREAKNPPKGVDVSRGPGGAVTLTRKDAKGRVVETETASRGPGGAVSYGKSRWKDGQLAVLALTADGKGGATERRQLLDRVPASKTGVDPLSCPAGRNVFSQTRTYSPDRLVQTTAGAKGSNTITTSFRTQAGAGGLNKYVAGGRKPDGSPNFDGGKPVLVMEQRVQNTPTKGPPSDTTQTTFAQGHSVATGLADDNPDEKARRATQWRLSVQTSPTQRVDETFVEGSETDKTRTVTNVDPATNTVSTNTSATWEDGQGTHSSSASSSTTYDDLGRVTAATRSETDDAGETKSQAYARTEKQTARGLEITEHVSGERSSPGAASHQAAGASPLAVSAFPRQSLAGRTLVDKTTKTLVSPRGPRLLSSEETIRDQGGVTRASLDEGGFRLERDGAALPPSALERESPEAESALAAYSGVAKDVSTYTGLAAKGLTIAGNARGAAAAVLAGLALRGGAAGDRAVQVAGALGRYGGALSKALGEGRVSAVLGGAKALGTAGGVVSGALELSGTVNEAQEAVRLASAKTALGAVKGFFGGAAELGDAGEAAKGLGLPSTLLGKLEPLGKLGKVGVGAGVALGGFEVIDGIGRGSAKEIGDGAIDLGGVAATVGTAALVGDTFTPVGAVAAAGVALAVIGVKALWDGFFGGAPDPQRIAEVDV